jgi:hypothetical protein
MVPASSLAMGRGVHSAAAGSILPFSPHRVECPLLLNTQRKGTASSAMDKRLIWTIVLPPAS